MWTAKIPKCGRLGGPALWSTFGRTIHKIVGLYFFRCHWVTAVFLSNDCMSYVHMRISAPTSPPRFDNAHLNVMQRRYGTNNLLHCAWGPAAREPETALPLPRRAAGRDVGQRFVDMGASVRPWIHLRACCMAVWVRTLNTNEGVTYCWQSIADGGLLSSA